MPAGHRGRAVFSRYDRVLSGTADAAAGYFMGSWPHLQNAQIHKLDSYGHDDTLVGTPGR
jgi:hypothetical protein